MNRNYFIISEILNQSNVNEAGWIPWMAKRAQGIGRFVRGIGQAGIRAVKTPQGAGQALKTAGKVALGTAAVGTGLAGAGVYGAGKGTLGTARYVGRVGRGLATGQ